MKKDEAFGVVCTSFVFEYIARAEEQIKYFACMVECVVTVLDSGATCREMVRDLDHNHIVS